MEGRPRGAVLSHGNLVAANMQVITSMGLTGKDVNLNMLPLFHITGLNLALAVMQVGGRNFCFAAIYCATALCIPRPMA